MVNVKNKLIKGFLLSPCGCLGVFRLYKMIGYICRKSSGRILKNIYWRIFFEVMLIVNINPSKYFAISL